MSCAGQTGPSGETPSQAACRTTWYDSTGKAWQDYADGLITVEQLRQALDAANAAFAACMASAGS